MNECKQKKPGFVKKILRAECSFCLTKLTLALFLSLARFFSCICSFFNHWVCFDAIAHKNTHQMQFYVSFFIFSSKNTHFDWKHTHFTLNTDKMQFYVSWSDFVCLSIDFDLRLSFGVKMTPKRRFGVKMTPKPPFWGVKPPWGGTPPKTSKTNGFWMVPK